MSFHRTISFLLLLMIVGVLPGWGQARPDARNTFSIAGAVTDDSDEHRLAEVRVELKSTSADSVTMTITDGNGRFELTGVVAGNYVIELTSQGYEPIQEPITILNSTLHGLSFSLRRSTDAASTSSSQSSVSAHELSVPHKAHDEYQKGVDLLYSKSDYEGAVVQFQHAIKDFPNFYEAYAKEGSAYVSLKQIPDAEKSFRKSVELSSGKYPEALFLLSGLLNNTNRYSEAEGLCRKGIATDGGSALGHFELGRALAAQNKSEEAEKNMIQARDLMPGNPQIYLFLTNIHIQQRDYPAALKDLDGYLKLDPTGPGADEVRKTQATLQAAVLKNPGQAQSNPQSQTNKREQAKSKKQTASDEQGSPQSGDENPPTLLSPPGPGQLQ